MAVYMPVLLAAKPVRGPMGRAVLEQIPTDEDHYVYPAY